MAVAPAEENRKVPFGQHYGEPAWQEARYGQRWNQGLDGLAAYNEDTKVEPMRRALRELGAAVLLPALARERAANPFQIVVEHAGLVGHQLGQDVAGRGRRGNPVDPARPFTDLLRGDRDTELAALAHADIPFEQVVAALGHDPRATGALLARLFAWRVGIWLYVAALTYIVAVKLTADSSLVMAAPSCRGTPQGRMCDASVTHPAIAVTAV